jgi:hypothetical protein
MPAPTGAFVAKNATVTIDAVQYANQVRIARLVPDQPVQTYRTLVPDGAVQDVDSAVWTFELTGLQINKEGGLARALRALTPGETVAVILAPQAGEGDSAAFTIMGVQPPFGGEQGAFATMELVFPVVGSPVFTDLDEE